ncbi:11117_t:CDS:2, partial [Gigaspora rosea]
SKPFEELEDMAQNVHNNDDVFLINPNLDQPNFSPSARPLEDKKEPYRIKEDLIEGQGAFEVWQNKNNKIIKKQDKISEDLEEVGFFSDRTFFEMVSKLDIGLLEMEEQNRLNKLLLEY